MVAVRGRYMKLWRSAQAQQIVFRLLSFDAPRGIVLHIPILIINLASLAVQLCHLQETGSSRSAGIVTINRAQKQCPKYPPVIQA